MTARESNHGNGQERTGDERPTATFTIHDADGPRLRTDSANVAEAHTRLGFLVTATMGAGHD